MFTETKLTPSENSSENFMTSKQAYTTEAGSLCASMMNFVESHVKKSYFVNRWRFSSNEMKHNKI